MYEVDYLLARHVDGEELPNGLALRLPSIEKNTSLLMVVPPTEQRVLEHAMDCLPWASLSWSTHRGLRDFLVAFAKPKMNKYRKTLASQLRLAVDNHQHQLEAKGWAPEFIRSSMAELAANSVLAGSGNSGDSVRVLTEVALLITSSEQLEMDETRFWRQGRQNLNQDSSLSTDAIVVLTKCFVLEWSIEFDYQIYHDLPPELLCWCTIECTILSISNSKNIPLKRFTSHRLILPGL